MPRYPEMDRSILEAAIIGYQHQRTEIEGKIADIRRQLGGKASPSVETAAEPAAQKPGKRVLSAAARARIAAAQKKRWASFKKAQAKPAAAAPAPKRTMSAAGRKRIAEATKKRWAAFRAQKAADEKTS